MNLIEKKVRQLMIDYADGGTAYFDAFDMCMRGESQIILQLIATTEPYRPIALQGNFGLAVKNLMMIHNVERPGVFWVRTSVRKGEEPVIDHQGDILVNPIFIDDSCYSGRTIEGVDRLLTKRYGLNVQETNVIYDGMKGARQKSVNSFFRYYDHY
jgi:hypothetical protein